MRPALAGGWFVRRTGETVPYSDPKVRQSQDGRFHLCINPLASARVICIYVPPGGV